MIEPFQQELKTFKIQNLSSQVLQSVPHDTQVQEMVSKMLGQKLSCVLITQNDEVVGIVTERGLMALLAKDSEYQNTKPLLASDIMSSPVITLRSDATLFDAIGVAKEKKIRHFPLTSPQGEIVNMLTVTDLANAHLDVYESLNHELKHQVEKQTLELRIANADLAALSRTDILMNIGNRRALETDLTYNVAMAQRYKQDFSVALFDLDFFKKYNDHYGHLAGDEALRAVSRVLGAAKRDLDKLYRYGGEEILLSMPNTDQKLAEKIAHRLIDNLELENIPHETTQRGYLTISAGVSGLAVQADTENNKAPNNKKDYQNICNKLLNNADEALYHAKESGRNCAKTKLTTIPPH